jgi:hypothetical protein
MCGISRDLGHVHHHHRHRHDHLLPHPDQRWAAKLQPHSHDLDLLTVFQLRRLGTHHHVGLAQLALDDFASPRGEQQGDFVQGFSQALLRRKRFVPLQVQVQRQRFAQAQTYFQQSLYF